MQEKLKRHPNSLGVFHVIWFDICLNGGAIWTTRESLDEIANSNCATDESAADSVEVLAGVVMWSQELRLPIQDLPGKL